MGSDVSGLHKSLRAAKTTEGRGNHLRFLFDHFHKNPKFCYTCNSRGPFHKTSVTFWSSAPSHTWWLSEEPVIDQEMQDGSETFYLSLYHDPAIAALRVVYL